MSADLEKLLAEATPGRRVQFHGSYCPEAVGTPFTEWDSSHQTSVILPDGKRYRGYATHKHASDAALDALAPDLARQVIALTAENAALRAKAEKLAGELDSMCCALHAEGDAHLVTKAKTARLMEAATPFSEMAGEMFARNWNKDGVAISFVTPDGPIRLTFAHFLALRQAATALETP